MEESFSNQGWQQDIEIRDLLTGAYSCALLHEQLPVEIDRAKRYGIALSLCMIDLDHFKSINDAYGHSRGDEVLRFFTQNMHSIIRKSDLLFRYGGDEFVLLMLNTNKEQAVITAERILERIKASQIPGDPPINLTLSMGLASFPEDGSSKESLFKSADERCYEAKRRGRGQVVSEIFVFERDFQFDKMSRLIERDEAFTKLNSFFQELQRKRRGIFNITGITGSGRTSFINKAASLSEILNYEVITLYANQQLKGRAYGVFTGSNTRDILTGRSAFEEFERFIVNNLKKKNRSGLIIVLDNFPDVDHATLNLMRQLLISRESFSFGLIYSSTPDSIRNFSHLGVPLFEAVTLTPFSRKGMCVWIRTILSWDPPEDFTDWLYKETRGLPKLLKEGISLLLEQGILQHKGKHLWYIDSSYTTVMLYRHLVKGSQAPSNNLPYMLTEFVERESEVKQVNMLLDRGRLVTLVGPGGIGKTRLSLQVASMRLADFEDGVFFVPLTQITQPDLVVHTIAKELKIKEVPEKTIFESLKDTLHNKHCLLVIDNFEHVIRSAPLIAELLTSLPLLSILVTSREVLRVSGEFVFNVPPLEMPEPAQKLPLEKLVQKAAIALFVTRAQAIQYDFVINENNAPLIAELCARLEGIPLAIELAAANIVNVSLHDMLEQCRNRLNWLSNGLRDLPSRHQTLRSTIEWSYGLLDDRERNLFNCLGVFTGEFEIAAVESIVKMNYKEDRHISEVLTSLTNKSLLKKALAVGKMNEVYFEMLETIREFACECLAASGNEGDLKQSHADYYLSLVTTAERNLNGPDQQKWLDRLERAHSNIRAALEWIQSKGLPERELMMAGALGAFWEIRGYWSEGRTRLEKIIDIYKGTLKSEHFAKVYQWAGRLIHLRGDQEKAMSLLHNGLKMCRENGDQHGEASVLYMLGWAVSELGRLKEEKDYWLQSLDLYRKLQDKTGMAASLQSLGLVFYYEGEYELAEKYSSESLRLSRELGDGRGISRALNKLGLVARGVGDYERAVELFKEHLTLCEELDDKEGIAYSLLSLAELARSQRDYKLAEEYYKKCLKLSRELGFKFLIARSIKDLGELARYQGDYKKAEDFYNESLLILQETNGQGEMMWLYRNMGELQFQQGNYSLAKEFYIKSLHIFRESNQGTILLIVLVFKGLAGVAAAQGDLVRASKLFGAAEPLFKSTEKMIAEDDKEEYRLRLSDVCKKTNKEIFAKAWNEGGKMTLKESIDYAMQCKQHMV